MTEVQQAVTGYDGKHTDDLAQISGLNDSDIEILQEYFNSDEKDQDAATWLIRYNVNNKKLHLSKQQVLSILANAMSLTSWGAILHIAQMLHEVDMDSDVAERAVPYLRKHINHDKPMVLAWSISALAQCARIDTSLEEEVESLVTKHADHPAAAVRARLRKI